MESMKHNIIFSKWRYFWIACRDKFMFQF